MLTAGPGMMPPGNYAPNYPNNYSPNPGMGYPTHPGYTM